MASESPKLARSTEGLRRKPPNPVTARGSHGRDKGIPVHFLGLTDSTIHRHTVSKSCQSLLFLTNLGSQRQPTQRWEGESRESPRDKGDLGSFWDVSVIPSPGLASHKHQGSPMHSGTLYLCYPTGREGAREGDSPTQISPGRSVSRRGLQSS